MKTGKITLALLLSLLCLVTCLAGCSASTNTAAMDSAPQESYKNSYDAPAASEPMDEPAADYDYADDVVAEESFSTSSSSNGMVGSTDGSAETETIPDFAEKIIYTGYVNVETTDFDDAVADLEQIVKKLGGFVQDSSVEGRSRTYSDGTTAVVDRWAHYTVRIPSAQFDSFLTRTGTIGNVTSTSRSAQNVTSQYTDYEARLSSLTIQEERLLDMLEQSGDLESLITLEARLSEVRYEIESIERNLRNLDQRLSYSTVNLNIREVEVYTPTVTVTRTFGQKLSDAFGDGWNGFVRGMQDFCLWLAESLPSLVVLAVIVVAAVLVLRVLRRRHRAKLAAKKATAEQNDKTE